MKTKTHPPIIPKSYNPALIRGTPEWAKAFNRWAMHVRGELADDRMVREAKKILNNVK